MSDGQMVLRVESTSKRFGSVQANDAVSLHVGPGEVVGLLGHNGAGKTTLVSQILGLVRPDAGSIRVSDVDAIADPAAARRSVALQAQTQAPIEGFTPRTAITLSGQLRGMDAAVAARAAIHLAKELAIEEWLDTRAGPQSSGLSGGIRRLTAFAMAVVAPVPLVVLDEPTNDVDPARRRRLWEVVRRCADRGSGVLLVTHNVNEAERAVDRLVVLDHGRVVAAGRPAELRGGAVGSVRLEVICHPERAPASLNLPVVAQADVIVGRRRLVTVGRPDVETVVGWAARSTDDGDIESYSLGPTSLEETYLSLTDEGESSIEGSSDG